MAMCDGSRITLESQTDLVLDFLIDIELDGCFSEERDRDGEADIDIRVETPTARVTALDTDRDGSAFVKVGDGQSVVFEAA